MLVMQIRQLVGLTGQLLFCTTRVLQVNGTVTMSFMVYTIGIPYSPTVFSFNFVNITILRYYQNNPELERFVLSRLSQLLIQETFTFKDILQSITLDEN